MHWQTVVDEHGRTYFWNSSTNEVTWTDPRGAKSYVRTRFSIVGSRVRLELKLCREQHTIVDRIWKQLTQKELDFRELANMFRNSILAKTVRIITCSDMTRYFLVWKRFVHYHTFMELKTAALFFIKWEERKRQHNGMHHMMKQIAQENSSLTRELASCKLKLAESSFANLAHPTKAFASLSAQSTNRGTS